MNKIALILLLGVNLVVSQAFAQAEDEVMYEEDGVEYVEDDVEYTDEDVEADEGIVEEYEGEDEGVVDDGIYEEDDLESNATMRNNESVDNTDITRWTDSAQDIARKQARAKREAQKEAEYKQNLTRKRRGGFIGLGTGYSALALSQIPGTNAYLQAKGAGLGIFVGYQHALNMYSGFRVYVEGDINLNKGVFWGRAQDAPRDVNLAFKALANFDMYLEGNMGRNYTETLGVFVGLGAGYILEPEYKTNMVAVTINSGVHSIILTHHRIELFARLYPQYSIKKGNMDIWLRYSYMF